ncbi:hypothetical protein DPMN_110594 [Dreissena polymorpha]|uniref:Uncharacterized protein n=1 Tax=Dreissena polymorpha TaxID=45954 RepID=A0A9D4KD43_DREPO|nr:hypothetical protein DPMN_110594 [Dreissena polymorpha]
MARQRPTRIPTPHVLPMGAPGLVNGPCIVEIDRIFIRDVQYQFEVNRCRNEEVSRSAGHTPGAESNAHTHARTDGRRKPRHDISSSGLRPFQGSSANSVGGDSGQDGRTHE